MGGENGLGEFKVKSPFFFFGKSLTISVMGYLLLILVLICLIEVANGQFGVGRKKDKVCMMCITTYSLCIHQIQERLATSWDMDWSLY